MPAFFSDSVWEFRLSSRKKPQALPANLLVPVLVTTVSTPPVERPYSALYCWVWMLNSATLSRLKFWSAPPIVSSVLSPPSIR